MFYFQKESQQRVLLANFTLFPINLLLAQITILFSYWRLKKNQLRNKCKKCILIKEFIFSLQSKKNGTDSKNRINKLLNRFYF